MARFAAAELLGRSAGNRISLPQLAAQMEEMAVNDPELAEHFRRQAAALPALRALRAIEDREINHRHDLRRSSLVVPVTDRQATADPWPQRS